MKMLFVFLSALLLTTGCSAEQGDTWKRALAGAGNGYLAATANRSYQSTYVAQKTVTCQAIGNMLYCSDGTSCQRIGNMTYCSVR